MNPTTQRFISKCFGVLVFGILLTVILTGIFYARDAKAEYVLKKTYDGYASGCLKQEEAQAVVEAGIGFGDEARTQKYADSESCIAAMAKFTLDEVVATYKSPKGTTLVVKGTVYGYYDVPPIPAFQQFLSPELYNAFEKPDTVYFIVGDTVVDKPTPKPKHPRSI